MNDIIIISAAPTIVEFIALGMSDELIHEVTRMWSMFMRPNSLVSMFGEGMRPCAQAMASSDQRHLALPELSLMASVLQATGGEKMYREQAYSNTRLLREINKVIGDLSKRIRWKREGEPPMNSMACADGRIWWLVGKGTVKSSRGTIDVYKGVRAWAFRHMGWNEHLGMTDQLELYQCDLIRSGCSGVITRWI